MTTDSDINKNKAAGTTPAATLNKDNSSASVELSHSTQNKTVTVLSPYVMERIIKINKKAATSLYYQQNLKYFPLRKNYIGASGTASRTMLRNVNELLKYMPSLINTSENHPDFYTRCKLYFDSIIVEVTDNDLQLECSFIYDDKSYYDAYEKEFNTILTTFEKADKSNAEKRDAAFKIRDASIIKLESEQYKYGTPINPKDYILYRHCMIYDRVASDIALINSRGNIDFYITDDRLESTKRNFMHDIKKKAHGYFGKLYDDKVKRSNILYTLRKGNISKMSDADQMAIFEQMLISDPLKLVDLYDDTQLSNKSLVEQFIQIGVLKRLPNTDAITNQDDEIIGTNSKEVIAWITDSNNRSVVSAWKAKLSQLI